jgi:xylulokinase
MHGKHGDLILEKSGSFSTYGHKILYWKKRNEWDDIHAFVHPSAFVAGRLAGLRGDEAYMDETFICFSGLSDLRKSSWSEEVCGALGLGMEKLPRIVKPTEIVGELTAEAAGDTGLPRGVPVIAGCGDQAAGFAGAGILSPGRMVDVSGTACIFGANTARFTCDVRRRTVVCMRSAWGDTYCLMSVVLGGMTHKWLVETFFPDMREPADARNATEGKRTTRGDDTLDGPGSAGKQLPDAYSRLDREAAKLPPGSDGLVSINYLQGRFFPPDPAVRGLFVGHSLAHRRVHFYRAVLESIAYDHAIAKEIIRGLLPELVMGRVTAIGSGARSGLWMRIKADVLQLPYDSLHRSDLSTLGSALLAGNGVGAFPDVEAAAKRFVARRESVEPVPGEDEKYRRYVEIYRDLFTALEGVYAKLAT